jgi:alanyl-tRNA synthetase
MNAQDIRNKYLEFMKQRKHAVIPRALLVPKEEAGVLFTGSGMQPLIPYLLGESHPKGTRLVDSQTCLRAGDIEEVGDNRHTTFFEMLGNWSLGDYFKEEQLPWFFEFLVDVVGLDPNKLYVTCFSGDEEFKIPRDEVSAKLWEKLFKSKNVSADIADIGSEKDGYRIGMKPGQRIFYYDASKNWWAPEGKPSDMSVGQPGGPDSEVFYLFDSVEHDTSWGEQCHPNCDCGRFMDFQSCQNKTSTLVVV